MKKSYPAIVPAIDSAQSDLTALYASAIQRVMQHILPPNFFEGEDVETRLEHELPLICWTRLKEPPFEISFSSVPPFVQMRFGFFMRW